MLAFVIRRLIATVVLVLATMLVTFALMRGMGGSPFSTTLDPHSGVPLPVELRLREFYRLDEPWFVEYTNYVKHVFTFEFGPSLVPPARFGAQRISVDEVMRDSFPVTLQLAGLASLWAIALGIPLGLIAATKRRSPVDYLASSVATGLLVVPIFLFTTLFARHLVFGTDLFPPGWSSWHTRLLASFTLSLAPIGFIARLIRAAAVETLQEDYVRAARAKGLRLRRIVGVHVLRNSVTPFLSAAAPTLALLVTGAFFVEQAFAIPGAAEQLVDAAERRDYPMLMGLTVAVVIVVAIVNLAADVIAAVLDPRLREARR
ncbi:MAG TPA: ABC transporter permease [Gaiellaceae bacterium]|nr:ABC transporter permease [Gaiellaceae bacterium]